MSQTARKHAPVSVVRGAKRLCENDDCSRAFYDLNRTPAECPYCGSATTSGVVVRHEFEMAARQAKGKSYRLVEPAPVTRQADVDEEVAADDAAVNMPPDVLIDVDEEDAEATTEDIVEEASEDEAI
jgi:hypothetical protein